MLVSMARLLLSTSVVESLDPTTMMTVCYYQHRADKVHHLIFNLRISLTVEVQLQKRC